jgi:uncharacterized membrane protein YoaK (UPF0700 family)
MTRTNRLRMFALALAWVGGYVDAAGYLRLQSTFTGHITGNTVNFGIALAQHDWYGVFHRGFAVLLFLAGMLVGFGVTTFAVRATFRARMAVIFLAEAILFAIAATFGDALLHSHAFIGTYALIALCAIALGMQNGCFRSAGSSTVHTTYISGMATGALEGMFDHWDRRNESVPAASKSTPPWPVVATFAAIATCFAIGAITGAIAELSLGFHCIAFAALVLAVLAALDFVSTK